MRIMKKTLIALTLLTISASTLPDGGFGDVLRAPFVVTADVVEGTGDIVTLQNPVSAHERRAQRTNLRTQYKNGNITKAQYDQQLKQLNQKAK